MHLNALYMMFCALWRHRWFSLFRFLIYESIYISVLSCILVTSFVCQMLYMHSHESTHNAPLGGLMCCVLRSSYFFRHFVIHSHCLLTSSLVMYQGKIRLGRRYEGINGRNNIGLYGFENIFHWKQKDIKLI